MTLKYKIVKKYNKTSYLDSKINETCMLYNEYCVANFGKQCKVHRSPSLNLNNITKKAFSETAVCV